MMKDYQNLIDANNEVAEELIPSMKSKKRKIKSNDIRISKAREEVNSAFNSYHTEATDENHLLLQSEKDNLKKAYNIVFEEELENNIRKVENADAKSQHKESWRLINQISGRKTIKKGKIKANTNEERIEKWYQYFKQLLGNEPTISNDEEVSIILNNLEIDDGPFTYNEIWKVKRNLKTGKAAGPDGITADVIKYCDLDKIILVCKETTTQLGKT